MRTEAGCLAVLLCALGAAGCVARSTRSDLQAVRELASRPEGPRFEIAEPQAREQPQVDADVSKLSADTLTLDNAVRIALLNNRELRAELLGLGVERGQLVQANLLPELQFDLALRFPTRAQRPYDYDVGAAVDLTQLILRGARSEVARAELAAARVRVAAAALDLRYRVRLAYCEVQAAEQQLELMRTALAAFGASYDTAREFSRAGNATDLQLLTDQTAYESARVLVAEAEADVIDAHERLNVLLGLFGHAIEWHVTARLPEPTDASAEDDGLEQRAVAASLELAQTRASWLALTRRAGLAGAAGLLPDISVGVSAERHEGTWAVGPQVSGSLAVVDRQAGTRISAQAQADALRQRYEGLAIDIRAATRAARDRMKSARERARQYRETVLPLRERLVRESLLQYNAMQIGVFQLLQARRDQLDAGRNYVNTLLEYWRARSALDQLLAGRMAGTIVTVTQPRPGGLSGAAAGEGGH